MRRSTWRRPATLAAAALLLLSTACAGGEVETQPRSGSFAVGEAARLVVDSQNGDVTVVAGAAGEVRVEAILRDPDRVTYAVRQDGDTIEVEVKVEGITFGDVVNFNVDRGADLTVTVPATTSVAIETLTGDIELSGLTASGTIRTANGRIRLTEIEGDFAVDMSNGRVEVRAFEGDLRLTAKNSTVLILDSSGSFNVTVGRGRITFRGGLAAGGRNRLETANGRISVALMAPANLRIDARAERGRVDVDLPLVKTVDDDDHVVGTLGRDETELVLRTENGVIDVLSP